METKLNEIEINGIKYIASDSVNIKALNTEGLPYVIIRSNKAGVFAGYLKEDRDTVVVLNECRRLWYWDGANSLSDIAIKGVSQPTNCKFTKPVQEIKILDVIENIPTTEKARECIQNVWEWTIDE